MTLAITHEQSYAIMVTIGVASMLIPITLVLIRIANARMER